MVFELSTPLPVWVLPALINNLTLTINFIQFSHLLSIHDIVDFALICITVAEPYGRDWEVIYIRHPALVK